MRIRWYWNTLRYWFGLTAFSPATHEIRRMSAKLKP